MRDRLLRALGATSVALVLAMSASGALAQAPAARPRGLAAAPAAPVPVVHRLHRHHRRHSPTLDTVAAANTRSLSRPTAGEYVNATLYYDYEPGRLYTINTSPRFLTAITLRPGS